MGAYITQTIGPTEVTGSGTANTLPVWTGAQTLGNSMVSQDAGATTASISGALSVLGAFTITTGGSQRMAVNAGSSSGSTSSFVYSAPAHTNQTASTEAIGYSFTSANRQFATGALATQREYVFGSPTYSFVGASTLTDAYTMFITAPTEGTNATITNSWALGISGSVSISGIISTTGAQRGFLFTGAANTGQTASTEINGVLWTTTSRQWATGAITEQNEFKITSPTYSFVGASTITDASTLSVASPTAGTNATLTRANSLYLTHLTTATTYFKFYEESTTVARIETGGSMTLSAVAGSVYLRLYSGNRYSFNVNNSIFLPIATSGSIGSVYDFTVPANTTQTASSERFGFRIINSGRQWATGAITTQREYLFNAPTYSFVGASTITSAATFAISGAPTAGTNATITNAYSLWIQGGLARFDDSVLLGGSGTNTLSGEVLSVQKNQNALTWNVVVNTTSGAGARAGLAVFTIANLTTGVAMQAYSAGYTTSGIAVANASSLNSNMPAGLNIGTQNAAQCSIWTNAIQRIGISTGGSITITPTATATGALGGITFTGVINTNQTASTEISGLSWTTAGRQWATGAITTQREFLVTAPTYSFVGASTITTAATVAIGGAPVAGTNATITTSLALWIQAGTFRFDGNIVSGTKGIDTTTGDSATINATWGRFRKDATGTTFTVTNSFVDANSIIFVEKATAAITGGNVTDVVAGAGSFVVTFTSAPSADCDYNFVVLN